MAPPLRALYVDLDNTLLGRNASILHDGDGLQTNLGFRAVEACHRADVEVVIMSGRRRSGVFEAARLLGSRAYIFEAGAAVVDGPDEEWLTEPFMPDEGPTVFEQIEASGAPELLLRSFDIEYHAPWHTGREVSHLFRGAIDARDANALLAEHGHDDVRVVDNGGIDRPGLRAYHLVPKGVSKGRAVGRHMRVRGYAPEECIAVGDSREDLAVADVVGRMFLVANAVAGDASGHPNVERTEGAMTEGFYEAIVRSLAETK
jgi:hydroxymethylpyrimidine pyrophosphatase-like HAD family hydrolase